MPLRFPHIIRKLKSARRKDGKTTFLGGEKVLSKNEYRYLNIKGTVLDNYQLQNYMEKIASNHEIKKTTEKWTYPIPRLKD